MTSIRSLPLLFAACLAPALVQAAPDTLRFSGAWIREAPAASPVMAGYVSIENKGKGEVLIDAVQSAQFDSAQIHEMREVNGVMRMRPVRQLQLEPEQVVVLEPGGLHLMLMSPAAPLAAGDHATVEFVLADGTRRSVDFEVRAASE
jgi:copper(I)-binding protein